MIGSWLSIGLALIATAATTPARSASVLRNDQATVRVRTVHEGRSVEGTAVLVAVERKGGDPILYFVSAARLFAQPDGDPAIDIVRLLAADGQAVDVHADQVLRPVGNVSGVALIRVAWPLAAMTPIPIDLEEPTVGGVFVIAGFGADGRSVNVPERVQYRATRLVTGDRAVADLYGPLGAAAISPQGVFGIVTESEPGRSPIIVLLSSMHAFLARHLPASPRLQTETRPPAHFELAEWQLTGPFLSVGCAAISAGVIELSHQLSRNEKPVDATASFVNATSLKLADLAVLGLDDRNIKLRFTMIGVPPQLFSSPEPCPEGQALVTVRVNVVVLPHQE
jgi:hypothetical protein